MSANSLGNGVHSTRSINVRANLLSEWTTDQVRFRAESFRYSAVIAGLVLVMATGVPLLESNRSALAPSIKAENQQLGELKTNLDQANNAKKEREPAMAAAEIATETSGYFDRLMGEIYVVLNSANAGLVFSSAKAEVQAAEISIDCKADAENFEVAEFFAQGAGQGPNKLSTLTSIRPGGLFKSGINFDYLKKVPIK